MITKDFVKDIELYICEKFGYRNSVYVNPTKRREVVFSPVGIQQRHQRLS